MNEVDDSEFIIERQDEDPARPVAQLTGWETVVFRIEDDAEQGS